MSATAPSGPGTPIGALVLPVAAVVAEDATLRDVAAIMVASGSSAVLVGDARSIVTERDVVRATARGVSGNSPARMHATDDPLVVPDSCRAIDALHAMLEYGVRNLVVVSEVPGGAARILNVARAAGVVLEGTGLPPWLSGLRLALHVEVPRSPPFTIGHENAGWVEAVGAGVHDLELGSPVAIYGPWGCGLCLRCREGMENYCERQATLGAAGGGLGRDGGMTPLLRVPSARHVVALTSLSPVEAAPLTDAGLTPYHAIKRSLPLLGPGSFAVVIGAGGLGHMATQILDACSPTSVIAVDPSAEALALVRTVGAAHTVLAGADTAAEVHDLTHGRGADLVLDLVGSDATLAMGAAVARQLGHLTLVGIAGGALPVSFFSPQYEVSVASTYWGSLPELMEVVALAEAGKIRAHVQRFSLDDAPRAYGAMRDGTLRGRAVIVP